MRLLHAILFVAMVLYGCASTRTSFTGDAHSDEVPGVDATIDGNHVEVSPGDAPDVAETSDTTVVPPLTPASLARRLVLMRGRTMVLNSDGVWHGWGDELGQSFGDVPTIPTREVTRLPLDERRYVHSFSPGTTCRTPRAGNRRPQCWGRNDGGQLGTGEVTGLARTPQDVLVLTDVDYINAEKGIAWTSEATFKWPLIVSRSPTVYDYRPRRVRTTPFCAISGTTLGGPIVAFDCESRELQIESWLGDSFGFQTIARLDDLVAFSQHDSDLAVLRDGTLLCRGICPATAGDTAWTGSDTLRRVAGLPPLRYAVSANSWSDACAITQQNGVVCWGDCATALYIGPVCESWTRETRYLRPTPIPGLEDVVELATGDRHACAITRRRELWCWGNNRAHAVVPTSELPVFYTPVRIDIPNL